MTTDLELMRRRYAYLKQTSAHRISSSREHYLWLVERLLKLEAVVRQIEQDPLNSKYEIAHETLAMLPESYGDIL